MKCVIFVPGIMGSILSTPDDGEQVWPPTPLEVAFGYKRKQKLLREDLVVGDIIRSVSCFDVYKPLVETITAIGFKESGPGDRLHLFPYDWRRMFGNALNTGRFTSASIRWCSAQITRCPERLLSPLKT